jgi:hypothetical protein
MFVRLLEPEPWQQSQKVDFLVRPEIIHQLSPVVLGRSVEELDEELVQILSTAVYVTLPFETIGSSS